MATDRARRDMGEQLGAMESFFRALADRTRLRILGLLMAGEVCVCDIHESLGIPQPKTSRHLAYLRRAGLVQDRRVGLWVYYRLASPADHLLRTLLASVGHSLTHVSITRQDRRRLEKETGQRRPVRFLTPPVPACCRLRAPTHRADDEPGR